MKNLLVLISVLALSTALWPQGEGDGTDCSQATINGTDTGCTVTPCNGSISECSTVTFTAACSGSYLWDVWTTCGTCKYCNTCSYIHLNGEQIPGGNCHTENCFASDCNTTCEVTLVAGREYVLYVCLYHCPLPVGNDCTNCDQNCTAHACLRYGAAATCY